MTNDNDARGALTDEQIVAIAAKSGIGPNSAIEFARAIQAASLPAGDGLTVTEAMMAAGGKVLIGAHERGNLSWADEAKACFEAMLFAAPRQPVEVGAGVDPTIQPNDQGLDGIDHGRHFSGGNQELPSETMARIRTAPVQQDVYAKGTDQVEFAQRLGKSASALPFDDQLGRACATGAAMAASAQQDEREAVEKWADESPAAGGERNAFIDGYRRAGQQVQADAGAVAWQVRSIGRLEFGWEACTQDFYERTAQYKQEAETSIELVRVEQVMLIEFDAMVSAAPSAGNGGAEGGDHG